MPRAYRSGAGQATGPDLDTTRERRLPSEGMSAIHVSYDLRYATDHFPGIGTFAFGLLEALLANEPGVRWSVIWNPRLSASRFDVDRIRSHPRVRWVEHAVRPLWPGDLLALGMRLRRIRPDAHFSPYHLWPVGAGIPSIVTLHDVRPLRFSDDGGFLRRFAVRASIRRAA